MNTATAQPIVLPTGPGEKVATSWTAYVQKHLPNVSKQSRRAFDYLAKIHPRGAQEREIAHATGISVKSITGALQPLEKRQVIFRDGTRGTFQYTDELGRLQSSTGLLYYAEKSPGSHPVCPGKDEKSRLRLTERLLAYVQDKEGSVPGEEWWNAWAQTLRLLDGKPEAYAYKPYTLKLRWDRFLDRWSLMKRIFPNES